MTKLTSGATQAIPRTVTTTIVTTHSHLAIWLSHYPTITTATAAATTIPAAAITIARLSVSEFRVLAM